MKKIVGKVDMFLVVGSENSSNSQRLVDVAKRGGCKDSFLIEDHTKINWEKLSKIKSLGLTSGASAPDQLIQKVIKSIQNKFNTNIISDTTRKELIEFKVPPILR